VSSGAGPERAYHALADAARYAQEGRFSLPVERTFSFADAAEAHRVSEAGHVRGKLVLVP
jgi:NADPH:quinone reductase-like Zn-dependent oxidoreductase